MSGNKETLIASGNLFLHTIYRTYAYAPIDTSYTTNANLCVLSAKMHQAGLEMAPDWKHLTSKNTMK